METRFALKGYYLQLNEAYFMGIGCVYQLWNDVTYWFECEISARLEEQNFRTDY